PHRLSGGQKQRVAIAGVIAISPKVLILDEATVMLDPRGRKQIMKTNSKLTTEEQLTIITITHDLYEITKIDRDIVLNQGEIWKVDTPAAVLQEGDALRDIGLDVPFITALSNQLRTEGILLEKEPFTIEEMVESLWTLHSKT